MQLLRLLQLLVAHDFNTSAMTYSSIILKDETFSFQTTVIKCSCTVYAHFFKCILNFIICKMEKYKNIFIFTKKIILSAYDYLYFTMSSHALVYETIA